jgi:hypothetical protein
VMIKSRKLIYNYGENHVFGLTHRSKEIIF